MSNPYPTLAVKRNWSLRFTLQITEYDGGRKSCILFVTTDDKELGKGYTHDCWSVVYGSEHTFGMFRWLLAARRCPPSEYQVPSSVWAQRGSMTPRRAEGRIKEATDAAWAAAA